MLLIVFLLVSIIPEIQSKEISGPDSLEGSVNDTLLVYKYTSAGISKWEPLDSTELRGRPVTINSEITAPRELSEKSILLFLLFDGEQLLGRITQIKRNPRNTLRVIGTFGRQGDFFTLSADTSRVFGHLYLRQPRQYYRIRYSDILESHVLVEIDPQKKDILPGSPPLTPPDTSDTANGNN